MARELATAPEIALDTEGDSLHHYPERLALLQLGLPDGTVWLVDPLVLADLAPLAPVFADQARTLVLHAGDNDLVHLKRRYGLTFASVFDSAIAGRFLGLRALGLDVLHLFALKAALVDELGRTGRLAWVEEECAALAAQPAPERPVDPVPWLGVKGARELPPRALAVLRELWTLREELARTADRPPFKILNEDTLLRIAQAAPPDTATLGALAGITPRVLGRWGGAILDAVESARALPESELPVLPRPRRPTISGATSRRIEKLRRWRAGATERIGLEAGVVLPNRLITAIAEAAPRTLGELSRVDGVRRWRVETLGAELLAAMTGP